jgi:hypothetical protein
VRNLAQALAARLPHVRIQVSADGCGRSVLREARSPHPLLAPSVRALRGGVQMKFFKWTVEIEVSETWVEDGFDLTDDRAHSIMTHALPHAYGHEIRCKVVAHPPDQDVASAQGYKFVNDYRKERR